MTPDLKTDVQFLRRILLSMLFAATFAGGMAGFTTVQAMSSSSACAVFCAE
jgi:hypothetical protein